MINKDRIYIYKVINSITGKSYVGQHSSSSKRDDYKGSGIYLLKAFKKYGRKCFTKEILYNSLPCRYHLDLKEQEYIKLHNTIVPNGYNISIGGNGPVGYIHTEEDKKKISERQMGRTPWNKGLKGVMPEPWNKGKGGYKCKKRTCTYTDEFRERLREVNLGKVMSKETRDKISKTTKGKIVSEETKLKISQAFLKREVVICPYCNISSNNKGVLRRWHFDNCLQNPNRILLKPQ